MAKHRCTRERILQQATALFGEKGYERVSMRQIAAAVGIKESSIYNHFEGKEEILNAIMLHFQGRMYHYHLSIAAIDRLLETENPEQVLRRFIPVFDESEYDAIMSMYRILFMEQYRNEQFRTMFLETILKPVQHLTHAINYMMEQGYVAPCDSESIAQIWAASHLVVAMEATHNLPKALVEAHYQNTTDLCIDLVFQGSDNSISPNRRARANVS